MNDQIITSPDEPGWYWYKSSPSGAISIVFVNDNGEATLSSEKGEQYNLDDLIGFWEKTEPQFL